MKITIKQIAKEAGVSVTTVPNVINNKTHRVSEDKKRLIETIIKKYDYIPNMNARALVQSSSRLIGLLYHSNKRSINFSDPFVAEVLEGIEHLAKATGYFTLIHEITSVQDIEMIKKNWRFEGFIIVGVFEPFFEEINSKIQEPIVFIDTHLPKERYEEVQPFTNRVFINTDDYLAGYTVTHYLITKAHKKIAFLAYPFEINQASVVQQRFNGYVQALKEQKLTVNEGAIFTNDGLNQLANALDQYTAIVVTADILAIEFIHYLKERNLYHQEKVAIISFDDIIYASLFDPPLTTIRLDQVKKGELAMEALADIIKEPDKTREQSQFLIGELVIRQSS